MFVGHGAAGVMEDILLRKMTHSPDAIPAMRVLRAALECEREQHRTRVRLRHETVQQECASEISMLDALGSHRTREGRRGGGAQEIGKPRIDSQLFMKPKSQTVQNGQVPL